MSDCVNSDEIYQNLSSDTEYESDAADNEEHYAHLLALESWPGC